jgi:hypothetical protein
MVFVVEGGNKGTHVHVKMMLEEKRKKEREKEGKRISMCAVQLPLEHRYPYWLIVHV